MAADKNLRNINPADRSTKSPAAKTCHGIIPGSEIEFSGVDQSGTKTRFTFIIKPSNFKFARKKLGQYTLTKFGYERQNWGNDLWSLEYSGVSGVFRPQDGGVNSGCPDFDITNSSAYLKFREFEEFYENTGNGQNLVEFKYWGYEGSFFGSIDDFQLSHDVMKDPYLFNYSFKYTGLPLKRINIDTNVVGTSVGDSTLDTARTDNPAT